MRLAVLSLATLGLSCQATDSLQSIRQAAPAGETVPTQAKTSGGQVTTVPGSDDPELDLEHFSSRPSTGRDWSVRYKFPVVIGYTDFDFGEGEAFESLTTLAIVPTAEFMRPIDCEWTLIPFVGVGGGWLIDSDVGILIVTTGLRAEWTRRLTEASELRVQPRIRYDANLNQPDGLLGDWGRCDLSVELRHALPMPFAGRRLEPGVYVQGFWFWNDIDFEVPGLAPDSVANQAEVGISLGTREPIEILGLELPRIFIGLRFGDGIQTLSIRFGEL